MSIDPRLMERRKTVAEDKAKRNVGRLLKFLLFGFIAGAGVWAIFSPWLSVSQVVATGIETSTAHSVLAENRVRAGTPMILIDVAKVESQLLRDPWIAEADVRRDWPDTVTVEVVEREPAAWVRTGGGWTRRALDGVALPSESVPDDTMAKIEMPELGDSEARNSLELTGALEFAVALPADLQPKMVITHQENELWATVSGYRVRLGRSDDMTEKALSLAALLEENPPKGSTLTLIAPTNPAALPPSADHADDTPDTTDDGADTNDDS
jgi:cell division protein FtsQ